MWGQRGLAHSSYEGPEAGGSSRPGTRLSVSAAAEMQSHLTPSDCETCCDKQRVVCVFVFPICTPDLACICTSELLILKLHWEKTALIDLHLLVAEMGMERVRETHPVSLVRNGQGPTEPGSALSFGKPDGRCTASLSFLRLLVRATCLLFWSL